MHCKPLRPDPNTFQEAVRAPGEWHSPDEAGIALESEGVVDVVEDEEEVVAETGECIVIPKGLPSPVLPSRNVGEAHNLAHSLQKLVSDLCFNWTQEQPSFCQPGREAHSPFILCRLLFPWRNRRGRDPHSARG